MALQTDQLNKEEKKDSKADIEHAHAHHPHPNQQAQEKKEQAQLKQEVQKEEKIGQINEKSEEIKKISEKPTEKLHEKQIKKSEVTAHGLSMHASKKHCMYICRFIRNKSIDKAIHDLELVIKLKKAVPFKGEIPHRKGMMSGRYPINAAKLFIKLLKGLRGNVLNNNLDLDKTKVYLASASWASRPQRTQGRKAKRANVMLKAREMEIKN